ncbi:PEP-CTERM sorting domain-containing protein [Oxalobacteraceae bacterium A2-2]
MPKVWKPCWLAVCLAVGAPLAHAAQVLDQNVSSGLMNVSSFDESMVAQSFQTSATNLSGAGLMLGSKAEPSGPVTISLWTALPTQGGIKLASGTAQGSASQWVDVAWNAVTVTPNQTYYLMFESDTILLISGGIKTYSNGMAYANGSAQPLYDYNFRTYSSSTFVAPPPVPEPATCGMLLGGLGMLGMLARRRAGKA